MSFLDRLKSFTEYVAKAGLSREDTVRAFEQFETNEMLSDPIRAARFILDNAVLKFDFVHDKSQNLLASKYLNDGVFTDDMFVRAINEEVLLRTIAVLLAVQKLATDEYFQEFFHTAAALLEKRISEHKPEQGSLEIEPVLKSYLQTFKSKHPPIEFSTLYATRVCGDDVYGEVVKTLLLSQGDYVLWEFQSVVNLFASISDHLYAMAKPPLADGQEVK